MVTDPSVTTLETEAEQHPEPPHRGPGRPPIITLPVVEKVARLIAMGLVEEQACLRVGVNHSSFRTACHRNAEFETAKKKAQADFLDEALNVIASGKKGWQGLAWILERRHGEQFRRTTGMELSGHVGPYSVGDLLAKKPLAQWTRADVDASVGAWRILRSWSKEQLEALDVRYEMEWGPLGGGGDWSDEKLEWSFMIAGRAKELETGVRGPTMSEALRALETGELSLPALPPTPPNRIASLAMGPPDSVPD